MSNIDEDIVDFLDLINFTLSDEFLNKWRYRFSVKFLKEFQTKVIKSLKDRKPLKLESLYKHLSKKCGYSPEQVKNLFEAGKGPVLDEKLIVEPAYESLFGPEGLISNIKKKIDSGDLYLVATDLIVYDPNNNNYYVTNPDFGVSLLDTGNAEALGTFAGSAYNNLIQTNLNAIYASKNLLPSTYTIGEAIDEVIRCNCDCWDLI
jgi:hypothetical protein